MRRRSDIERSSDAAPKRDTASRRENLHSRRHRGLWPCVRFDRNSSHMMLSNPVTPAISACRSDGDSSSRYRMTAARPLLSRATASWMTSSANFCAAVSSLLAGLKTANEREHHDTRQRSFHVPPRCAAQRPPFETMITRGHDPADHPRCTRLATVLARPRLCRSSHMPGALRVGCARPSRPSDPSSRTAALASRFRAHRYCAQSCP
jgi:hypothetical protein